MTRRFLAAVLAVVAGLFAGARASAEQPDQQVKRIYIVHFSHADFGFTDLQSVCRELQRRYLDIAVDAVLATRNGSPEQKFNWTAESVVAVEDWWRQASPPRREQFLAAIASGQLEVAAMPFNQTPFVDSAQWERLLHWLPEDLWQNLHPAVAVQNDVNGFPRRGQGPAGPRNHPPDDEHQPR